MPLFGHKDNTNRVEERDTLGHSGIGQGAGTTYDDQGYGAGAGVEPGYAAPNQTYESGATGMGHRTHNVNDDHHQYGAGVGGAGPGMRHGAHDPSMPAAASTMPTHGGGGAGSSTTGKIEHALGSALGSESLKAKGMQKEREANALKVQSSELAQAEQLEQEALMRRERAVGHGAHPHHKHLGGRPPGGTGAPGTYE